MQMSVALVMALAASRARATRPEKVRQLLHGGAEVGESGSPLEERPPVCWLKKDAKHDGVGHQLFSMLTVMGAHGTVGETGMCYVYNAAPREFIFDHMDEDSIAWKEAMDLMTGFYEDFPSKVGPKGCATAELIANSPISIRPVFQMPLLLHDICKDDKRTWSLDNLWYGSDIKSFNHRQLNSKPEAFMQAVIKNASALAVLAVPHLPRVADPPAVAVHMRFGDRSNNLLPMAEGQQTLFQSSKFHSMVSRFSSVRVFSDTTDSVKSFLTGTAVENAELCGPDCSTALQALASMVAADVFIGTFSDLSSTAALMRIGMGKEHTYMPSSWQWAHGFPETQLTIYTIADHHQEGCHDRCTPDQPDWCYWCGRHQTAVGLKWMNCCEPGGNYTAEHKCHGAAYSPGSAEQRQCVMPVEEA